MAPRRPGAAASLVAGASVFRASSGFAGAAVDRRKPTNGSSAPAASRRNRERDRAACCLEDIACLRRDVIRSLPGPLGGFPVVCRVVSDDMSNSWERKMIAHHHHPLGRDAAQNGLARLDRLRWGVVED